jgi:hypothetical protein
VRQSQRDRRLGRQRCTLREQTGELLGGEGIAQERDERLMVVVLAVPGRVDRRGSIALEDRGPREIPAYRDCARKELDTERYGRRRRVALGKERDRFASGSGGAVEIADRERELGKVICREREPRAIFADPQGLDDASREVDCELRFSQPEIRVRKVER